MSKEKETCQLVKRIKSLKINRFAFKVNFNDAETMQKTAKKVENMGVFVMLSPPGVKENYLLIADSENSAQKII